MQKYTYIYWIHTDAMITDARRLLYKNIYLSLYCKGSKRVTQGLHVRGSWRPNITKIFWPQSYSRQRCVFPVLEGCSTGALESTLLGTGFPYYILSHSHSNSTRLFSFCSIRQPYITFKLPRSDMDTPPRLRNFFRYLAIGMCHFRLSLEWPVWSSSSGNNCHAVQRSLSSGASIYESILGFFFTSSHFISQFPPTRFPLITAIRMCHFLPVHHLEWHFWPGQKVKT